MAAIATGETARFRVCANDGCRWVFEDTSRGGRRRWCDMSSCGNRAKVRRFRSRRRRGEGPRQTRGGRDRSCRRLAPREQRLDLRREADHRLLVVVRRHPRDEVPVPEVEVRGELLGDVLRCPDRLVRPRRATRLRSNASRNSRSASARSSRMKIVPIPVVRSISAGSRPTVSQCAHEDLVLASDVLDAAADVVHVAVLRDELERDLARRRRRCRSAGAAGSGPGRLRVSFAW